MMAEPMKMRLPGCDRWGVPVEKMPHCPRCGADELGMITPGRALCYACGLRAEALALG